MLPYILDRQTSTLRKQTLSVRFHQIKINEIYPKLPIYVFSKEHERKAKDMLSILALQRCRPEEIFATRLLSSKKCSTSGVFREATLEVESLRFSLFSAQMSRKVSNRFVFWSFNPALYFEQFWTNCFRLRSDPQNHRSTSFLRVLENFFDGKIERVLFTYKRFLWTKQEEISCEQAIFTKILNFRLRTVVHQ